MTRQNELIDEIRSRLEHLRNMPETPARRREIMGLERALEEAPKMKVRRPRAARSLERRLDQYDDVDDEEETVDEEPIRHVKGRDGQRRTIVSIRKPVKKPDGDEEEDLRRSRKSRRSDIGDILGTTHRGMS
jgi:hypothetical protein